RLTEVVNPMFRISDTSVEGGPGHPWAEHTVLCMRLVKAAGGKHFRKRRFRMRVGEILYDPHRHFVQVKQNDFSHTCICLVATRSTNCVRSTHKCLEDRLRTLNRKNA